MAIHRFFPGDAVGPRSVAVRCAHTPYTLIDDDHAYSFAIVCEVRAVSRPPWIAYKINYVGEGVVCTQLYHEDDLALIYGRDGREMRSKCKSTKAPLFVGATCTLKDNISYPGAHNRWVCVSLSGSVPVLRDANGFIPSRPSPLEAVLVDVAPTRHGVGYIGIHDCVRIGEESVNVEVVSSLLADSYTSIKALAGVLPFMP